MSALASNETAFTPFVNLIYDTADLYKLIDQITTLERFLFRDKEGTLVQKGSDFLPANLQDIFLELENRGLEPADDQNQLEFLKDLVSNLRKVPSVKVTLAFEPTKTFVINLNRQISALCGQKMVLDILVNQSIVGGAIFEYKGKVSEFTLASKLNESIVNWLSTQIKS